ncbi:hypothetical protein EDB86DRAFT_3111628 [Lactarius hatsudake]|nr:hypothetical protein EDB86DRAFT_3111628 [Lactarius hatsudake]
MRSRCKVTSGSGPEIACFQSFRSRSGVAWLSCHFHLAFSRRHISLSITTSRLPLPLSLSLSAPACYLCHSNTITCACPSRGLQAVRRQAVHPRVSCRLCPSTSRARRIAHLPFPFKMSRSTIIRPLPLKPPSRRRWRLRGLSRSLKGSIVFSLVWFPPPLSCVPRDRPGSQALPRALEGHRLSSPLVSSLVSALAPVSALSSRPSTPAPAFVRSRSHRLSPSRTLRTRLLSPPSVTLRDPLRLRTHTDLAPYNG